MVIREANRLWNLNPSLSDRQFPIFQQPATGKEIARFQGMVKGVPVNAVAEIEALQPYQSPMGSGVAPPEDGAELGKFYGSEHMKMDIHPSLDIAFPGVGSTDLEPVIPCLQKLRDFVVGVV
ncbi:MAG: hypothetical protein O7D91_04860, partial [Planctomycetota bacterium]|nr:hypothetical protein [Planctomycetota bacterium]